MSFIKRILCSLSGKHSATVFVRNIYGDEIHEWGGNRSLWRCKNCECVSPWPYLGMPPAPAGDPGKVAQQDDAAEIAYLRRERTSLVRDLRMSTRVIDMQLQTIKELEAQLAALQAPGAGHGGAST